MDIGKILCLWLSKYSSETVFEGGKIFYWNGKPYFRARCPFCQRNETLGPDRSHHLYVHEYWFRCMRCGEKGSITSLGLESHKGIKSAPRNFQSETLRTNESKIFTPNKNYSPNSNEEDFQEFDKKVISPGNCIPLQKISDKNHVAWKFLFEDGFDEDFLFSRVLPYFKILYCVKGLDFKSGNSTTHRLILPIYESGEMVGWQARWLPSPQKTGEESKYIFNPGFKKSFYLYNWEKALEWDTIVVVEGIKKVWKTGNYAVASFGISNSTQCPQNIPEQWKEKFWITRLQRAANEGRKILFLYDRDGLVQSAYHCHALQKMGCQSQIIIIPSHKPKDLDKLLPEEITELILTQSKELPKKLPNQTQ